MAVHAILKVEILQNYIHFLRWNLRILLRVKHVFFYTWALRYRLAITIKTHGSVSCGPRSRRATREYINRKKENAIFTPM